MQLFAAWAAVAAVVGVTAAVAPSSEVRQQVALVLAQTLSGTEVMGGHNYQVQDGMLIADECTDAEWYSECSTVVQKRLCNKYVMYSHTCCRSCTLAGQLQAYGIHLDHRAHVKPSVSVGVRTGYAEVTEYGYAFTAGSEVRITCEYQGFPEPEVMWDFSGSRITPSPNVDILYSHSGDLSSGKRTTTLVLKSVQYDGYFGCTALNYVGRNRTYIKIETKGIESKVDIVQVPLITDGIVKAACEGQSNEKMEMVWHMSSGLNRTRLYDHQDEVREEGSVWKIKSQVTTAVVPDKLHCSIRVSAGDLPKASKSFPVYRSDKPEPACLDYWDGLRCYLSIPKCYSSPVVRGACCRSCTLYSDATMAGDDLTVEVEMAAPSRKKYGESLTLECRGRWYPTVPEVTWYKDGSQLATDGKYFISDESVDPVEDKMAERVSRLTVSELRLTDLGQYTCTAASPTSIASKIAQIYFYVYEDRFNIEVN